MDNTNSQLCTTCHSMGTTQITEHINCGNCHEIHTSPSGPYLLTQAKVSDTCITCHNGNTGANQGPNIAAVLSSTYPHDTQSPVNLANQIPTMWAARIATSRTR